MDNKIDSGLTVAGMTVEISPPRKPSTSKAPTRKKPIINEKARDKLYNALMSDPVSKKMVIDLIRDNKDKFEEFKRKEQLTSSPVNKIKKPIVFESPTALIRRKALEKQRKQLNSNENNEDESSTNCSTRSPKKPKQTLLKGVNAYVEVIGVGGINKSEPFKKILISMGATISISINKYCTHVIFKDGSFETYKRARRMKKVVVSILWVDAVNRTGIHVPEKNYPALGDYDSKVACDDLCDKLSSNTTSISDSMSSQSKSKEKIKANRRKTCLPSITLEIDDANLLPMSEDDDVFSNIPNSPLTPQNMVTTRRRTQRNVSQHSFDTYNSDDSDARSDVPVISGSPNKKSLQEIISSKELNDTVLRSLKSMRIKAADADKENTNATPNSEKNMRMSGNKSKTRKTSLFDSPLRNKSIAEGSKAVQCTTPTVTRRRKTLLPAEALNGIVEITKLSAVDMELTQVSDSSNSNLNATAIKKYSTRKTIHCNDTMELTNIASTSAKKQKSFKILSNQCIKPQRNSKCKTNDERESMRSEPDFINSDNQDGNTDFVENDNIDTNTKNVTKKSSISSTRSSTSDNLATFHKSRITRRMSKQLSLYKSNQENISEPIPHIRLSNNEDIHTEVIVKKKRSSTVPELSLRISDQSNVIDMSPLQLSVNSSQNKSSASKPTPEKNTTHVSVVSLLSSINSETNLSDNEEIQISNKDEKHESSINNKLIDNTSNANNGRKQVPNSFLLTSDESSNTSSLNDNAPRKNIISDDSETSSSDSINSTDNEEVQVSNNDDKQLTNSCNTSDESLSIDSSRSVPLKISCKDVKASDKSDCEEAAPIDNAKHNHSKQLKDPSEVSKQLKSNSMLITVKSPCNSTSIRSSSAERRTNYSATTESIVNSHCAQVHNASVLSHPALSNIDANIIQSTSCIKNNLCNSVDEHRKTVDQHKPSHQSIQSVNTGKSRYINEEIFSMPESSESSISQDLAKDKENSNSTCFKQPVPISIISKNQKLDYPVSNMSQQKHLNNSTSQLISNKDLQFTNFKSSESLFSSENIIESSQTNSVANQSSCPSSIAPNQKCTIVSTIKEITNSTISANRTKRKLYNPDDEYSKKEDDDFEKQRTAHAQSEISHLPSQSISRNKRKLEERLNALKIKAPNANNDIIKTTQKQMIENSLDLDDDFVPSTQFTQKTILTHTQKMIQRKFIVCSRFHRDQVIMFKNIVKKLGHFTIERNVTARTTHLVSMEPAKTLNILKAMSRGIWILRKKWLFDSMNAGKWLEEDSYEMTEFSPLVQHLRLQREAFTKIFSHDVFINCGPIFMADTCHPPEEELRDLITICKGTITNIPDEANILIGVSPINLKPSQVSVKESWVLDCVFYGRCKKFKNYLLK